MRMSSDAATMITKTTELFIAHLAQCVWNHVSKNLKRKTLTANDLRDIINTNPRFDFLRAPMRTAFSEQNSTDDSTPDDAVSEKKKKPVKKQPKIARKSKAGNSVKSKKQNQPKRKKLRNQD